MNVTHLPPPRLPEDYPLEFFPAAKAAIVAALEAADEAEQAGFDTLRDRLLAEARKEVDRIVISFAA